MRPTDDDKQALIEVVSIAGAILWGVLPLTADGLIDLVYGFNRRGDSLGGAAGGVPGVPGAGGCVSIAGAILWGVLPIERAIDGSLWQVSIAGAILWGVLPGGTSRDHH